MQTDSDTRPLSLNALILPHPQPSSTAQHHPDFSAPGSDIVLASKDNVSFHLHSFQLKTSSAWFRSMLSLPPPASAGRQMDEVIYVDEPSRVLDPLLRMACGMQVTPIADYDLVDEVLFAIEKYDMPGPLSIMRLMVMTPPLLEQPFRLYAIACRFGWEEEAKFASHKTLEYNLHSSELQPELQRLPSSALLKLFTLHRSRRDRLLKFLNDPPFVAGGTAQCGSCDATIDYHTWRELKYKITLEMDARPLGDTVINNGLEEWSESKSCWAAKCPGGKCDRALYDRKETSRVIRECMDLLPKTI